MSSTQRPVLVLQPSVNTTVVTTTTVTTTSYAPIPLPSLPPPSSPKDPKNYPLLHANLPKSLRKFPLVFPNGARATFTDGENSSAQGDDSEMQEEEEVVSGEGWRMLKRDEHTTGVGGGTVGLQEAVERFGRKRDNSSLMEGVETSRKRQRADAAPPSPLPSPHGSPPPPQWSPLQPDLSLTTLLTLPNLLNHFTALPPQLQSHFLLTLLRHSPLPVLRTLHSVLTPTLARDFLTLLPPELVSHILSYLPFSTLTRASRVSKPWRALIDSDAVLWRDLLKSTKIWFGGDSESAFTRAILYRRRQRLLASSSTNNPSPSSFTPPTTPTPTPSSSPPLPHPYKLLFKSRHLTLTSYLTNPRPHHISFPAHGSSVVTCLLFSHNRIISASDDHSIHIYNPLNGRLVLHLKGHEGGVWALAAAGGSLVSGSTDRTVRVWDLKTGKCEFVFGGHTSTVRCLSVVKPEWVDVGGGKRERWPKRPLIVTGSRDHSLRVWTLPKPGDASFKCYTTTTTSNNEGEETDLAEVCDASENPYHRKHLQGHDHAVRALAARGRTLVSGSYDCTVRVWDLVSGECKWVLVGHTQKVYSVVLDLPNAQAMSGSMDGTVRIWSLSLGTCLHTLTGHTSLVGLLSLSPSHLVSAAADSTLRIWDPKTGGLKHVLSAHMGAITCFWHDEWKVLSGSDGCLKMWSLRGLPLSSSSSNVVDNSLPNTAGVGVGVGMAQPGLVPVPGAGQPPIPGVGVGVPGIPGGAAQPGIVPQPQPTATQPPQVRDLLTGITGVWQVVSEGRWCVAASNRNDVTVLDVWDFGREASLHSHSHSYGGGTGEDVDDGMEGAEDMEEHPGIEGGVGVVERERERDARGQGGYTGAGYGQDEPESGWIGEPSGGWYDEDLFASSSSSSSAFGPHSSLGMDGTAEGFWGDGEFYARDDEDEDWEDPDGPEVKMGRIRAMAKVMAKGKPVSASAPGSKMRERGKGKEKQREVIDLVDEDLLVEDQDRDLVPFPSGEDGDDQDRDQAQDDEDDAMEMDEDADGDGDTFVPLKYAGLSMKDRKRLWAKELRERERERERARRAAAAAERERERAGQVQDDEQHEVEGELGLGTGSGMGLGEDEDMDEDMEGFEHRDRDGEENVPESQESVDLGGYVDNGDGGEGGDVDVDVEIRDVNPLGGTGSTTITAGAVPVPVPVAQPHAFRLAALTHAGHHGPSGAGTKNKQASSGVSSRASSRAGSAPGIAGGAGGSGSRAGSALGMASNTAIAGGAGGQTQGTTGSRLSRFMGGGGGASSSTTAAAAAAANPTQGGQAGQGLLSFGALGALGGATAQGAQGGAAGGQGTASRGFLPNNDESPTRPRIRHAGGGRSSRR